MKINDYFKLLRVKHYLKNLLIFAPFLFSGYTNYKDFMTCIIGFVIFSIVSSSLYIFNDVKDLEQDKIDARKLDHPIHTNKISIKKATQISIKLLILGIILSLLCTTLYSTLVIITYFIINIIYTLKLKKAKYLSFICFICFYLIRLTYGALILGLNLSIEIILFVLFITLFIISKKRINEKSNGSNKPILKKYSIKELELLNYISLSLSITIYLYWLIIHYKFTYLISFLILLLSLNVFLKFKKTDIVNEFWQNKTIIILAIIYGILITI